MTEIDITRHNNLIDPHLEIWEWQIPIYLFLGGLAAGLVVLSAVFRLTGREDRFPTIVKWGAVLAPVAVSIGMLMLLLDLTYKLHVFRFYMAFKPTAAMSWGAWILVVFYPLNALYLLSVFDAPSWLPAPLAAAFDWAKANKRPIAAGNLFVGAGLGVYTGVLLSGMTAIHLWNSGLLGPLFLISGLSAAAALGVLIERRKESKHWLSRVDAYLIGAELGLIALMVVDLLSGCGANQCAARFLLTGEYAAFFWVLVIGLGLVFPLVLEAMEQRLETVRMLWLVPVFVLAGGLALRFLFIVVGQAVSCGPAVAGM